MINGMVFSNGFFQLTEYLFANVMLPNEVSEQFFIDTGLIDNLVVSKSDSAAHLCRKMTRALTAVSQNVQPSSIAFSNTGSASSRLRLLPRPKLIPIAPNPGTGIWMSLKGSVLTILLCVIYFVRLLLACLLSFK
jgi:hypothetical protein